MDRETFDREIANLRRLADEITKAKHPAYSAASEDVFHNFKWAAEIAGTTPLQAWAVYFLKHVSAIMTFIKDPSIPQAEAIDGRFCDAHNYLDFAYGMIREQMLEAQKKADDERQAGERAPAGNVQPAAPGA